MKSSLWKERCEQTERRQEPVFYIEKKQTERDNGKQMKNEKHREMKMISLSLSLSLFLPRLFSLSLSLSFSQCFSLSLSLFLFFLHFPATSSPSSVFANAGRENAAECRPCE